MQINKQAVIVGNYRTDILEDAHALQMQWKRIRDRYVRERRKRRSAAVTESISHQVSIYLSCLHLFVFAHNVEINGAEGGKEVVIKELDGGTA